MSVRIQDGAALQALFLTATLSVSLPGPPASLTAWVFFDTDEAPSGTDVWTIWWYGNYGALTDNFITLEAVAGTSANTVKLRARGSDGTNELEAEVDNLSTGPISGQPAGRGWHCVSVVVENVGNSRRITLYVDDEPADTSPTGTLNIDTTVWSRFSVGRSGVGSPAGLEKFSIEQVAIWAGTLGAGGGSTPSDNARMYGERIPPVDAGTAGLAINAAPNFSSWYLTPHARGGLEITDDSVYDGVLNGGIFNIAREAQGGTPILGWDQTMHGTPRWSARTPVLRYAGVQGITPIPRPPFVEPSRLQPHFFFVGGPKREGFEMGQPVGYPNDQIRTMSFYRDPNMSQICKVDALSSGVLEPPYLDPVEDYLPQKDVAQIAKRLADWFEIQSFTAGRGVGPDKRYAGSVQLRGPGDGGLVGDPLKLRGWLGEFTSVPEFTYDGIADSIPLERHPQDSLPPPSVSVIAEPWSTWYREKGSAYHKPWMDHFWAALKQELDARGLCYPLRIHLDYEGWVRDTSQLRLATIPSLGLTDEPVGAWPQTELDPRKDTENLFYDLDPATGASRSRTLAQVQAADPAASYDIDHNFYDTENEDFARWWWRYEYACRTWAVFEAALATVKDYFPGTLVGDYYKYPCDHPQYQDVNQLPPRAFNSAPNASFPLDFGTPVLYTNNNWVDNVRGAYGGRVGYTIAESVRDVATMNIDAVANARVRSRLAPTLEDATRTFTYASGTPYTITEEDQRVVVEHGWRRGACEFLLFSFATDYGSGMIDKFEIKVNVARWLRDSVHSCAQHNQARTGRTARVGWRSM